MSVSLQIQETWKLVPELRDDVIGNQLAHKIINVTIAIFFGNTLLAFSFSLKARILTGTDNCVSCFLF